MKAKAKLKKNIVVSDKGFIFNPETGDSFSFNQTGIGLITLLKSGKTPAEIKKIVVKKYDVEPAAFENDFDDFVAQLQVFNLLIDENDK